MNGSLDLTKDWLIRALLNIDIAPILKTATDEVVAKLEVLLEVEDIEADVRSNLAAGSDASISVVTHEGENTEMTKTILNEVLNQEHLS